MSRSFARGPAVACALALAALQLCGRAQADEYPTRPVTIIVSLAPGTGMDTAVRLYGEKLAQRLGQPVVIENRPGGAGVVAGETIAKGTPDGYTLAVATSAVMIKTGGILAANEDIHRELLRTLKDARKATSTASPAPA